MSELDEQKALHKWLALSDIPHWHPLQECTIKNPNYRAKMKSCGWNRGLVDMLIYLSPERCITGKGAMIAVELKRPRTRQKNGEFYALSTEGIELKPEQKEFIEMMNSIPGCQGKTCFGWVEARDFVTKFLR